MHYLKEFLKTMGITVLLIVVLKTTGLLSSVAYVTQSVLLRTGIVNASTKVDEDAEFFDFKFSMNDLKGNTVNFDQYKGKVIFLNLWATWCGPCRAEMSGIQKLYDKIDREKIQFVILSTDRDEDREKVLPFIEEKSFTFPVFLLSGYITDQLRVPSIPTTLIISKDGKIVSKEVGTTNFNTSKFKKFLEQLSSQ